MLTTAAFWKGAFERALKTFVQTTVASLIAFVGAATTAWEVDWLTGVYSAVGIGLLAVVLSLATSIGNADFTAGAIVEPGPPIRSTSTAVEYATDEPGLFDRPDLR